MRLEKLLQCIGSTEESTFGEVCNELGDDKPIDKAEWREFFQILDQAEREGLVIVERTNGRFDSAILTSEGAAIALHGRR